MNNTNNNTNNNTTTAKATTKMSNLFDTGLNVIHLSHIDLDGYAASYVMKRYTNHHVTQLNCNYGEILDNLSEVSEDDIVIITDLNLSIDECRYLDLKTGGWMVIDHHASGKDAAASFPDNYFLDTSCSATMLLNNIMDALYPDIDNFLKKFSEMVSAYDTYQTGHKYFRKGMLLTNYVMNNPFEDESLRVKYLDFIFDEIAYLLIYEADVSEVECMYMERYQMWLANTFDRWYMNDEIPTNVKVAMAHESVIHNYITYMNSDIVVFQGISTATTQYVNELLFKMEQFKDMVLINLNDINGNVACRSVNDKAGKMAKRLGGGGHPNAGGSRIVIKDDAPLASLLELYRATDD